MRGRFSNREHFINRDASQKSSGNNLPNICSVIKWKKSMEQDDKSCQEKHVTSIMKQFIT